MNVLVIGNGGREHAIVQALAKSPKVDKIYAMKGNAGIGELAELVDVDYCDLKAVGDWVDSHKDVEYTVIAPDDPLALGLADELESRGHRVFGPRKNAAIIEASKAFSKALMKKYNIPTAKYETFSDFESAKAYLETCDIPVVLKADGLALGKGVLICKTREEALDGIKEMMLDKKFGNAGNTVVVEEFLEGPEVSALAFTDGKTLKPMITSCDHKRVFDHDEGLNTGGMGTFAPAPFYGEKTEKEVLEKIMLPTVNASVMKKPSNQRLIPRKEGEVFWERDTDMKEYRRLMVIWEMSISIYCPGCTITPIPASCPADVRVIMEITTACHQAKP